MMTYRVMPEFPAWWMCTSLALYQAMSPRNLYPTYQYGEGEEAVFSVYELYIPRPLIAGTLEEIADYYGVYVHPGGMDMPWHAWEEV